MKPRFITLLLIACHVTCACADHQPDTQGKAMVRDDIREWTSGEYKLKASVVKMSGEGIELTVTLKKEDGSTVDVPVKRLSENDRVFLKNWTEIPGDETKQVTNSIGMKLQLIKAGTFLMGGASDASTDEKPKHQVRITRDFYLGVTEVTQGQWESVMGTRPWQGKEYVRQGANYAATYVSWHDAVAFCNRLSEKEGAAFRLPTEAEWEYACRAGTTTKFSFGDDEKKLGDYAWFGGIVGDGTAKNERYAHQVGKKRPNPWRLYDMHGNVKEWCQDWFDRYPGGSVTDPITTRSDLVTKVVRGGAWTNVAKGCRSAGRNRGFVGDREDTIGFRVVQVSPNKDSPGESKGSR